MHRQAIYTCYTERTKTKREAGNVHLLKILNVNSALFNFIYNLKATTNTVAPWPNAGKAVYAQFTKGAFIAAFTSEK